jgi:ribonucleoside-diphosphate reductase alpha chain
MLHTSRPVKTGEWTESAIKVMQERYLARDQQGQKETPEDMCWRVATAIAAAEQEWGKSAEEIEAIAERFYHLMVDGLFLPNSPTLMNAGTNNGLGYSACFVLPVEDSIDGIFDAIKYAALIHKSGGGTGFAFSRLRPKGSQVRTTAGVASGPVSFMRVFDAATEQVKQGGRRRGANMGILRVDHPDILEFINSKLQGGITNFNISVAATDRFMAALVKDERYELIDPRTQQVTSTLLAREVFEQIIRAAWQTGDPGMVFIDRINTSRANPVPEIEQIEATNPCGEQPLGPNDACNLGSLNLIKFARPHHPAYQNGQGRLDWVELERVVRLAVRFLDDVIEVNPYPLPAIDAEVKRNRRIGLGVMGWADLLLELEIPYDSEEALALADRLMAFIERIGHEESARLAQERGPFPQWAQSIYRHEQPMRNATVTTVAPTGTISIIAGCSSGIEPLFAVAFSHIVGDRRLTFVNPQFERLARARGFYSEALMAKVAATGSVQGLPEVPTDVQRVYVTAHQIAPEWHVRTQAAFQRHLDNGCSKTINMPHTATVEDVGTAYLLAYESGCLGITVFRDGSKTDQVLHVGTEGKQDATATSGPAVTAAIASAGQDAGVESEATRQIVKPRPRRVQGVTYRVATPLGTAFITVNINGNEEPFEVFANVGKAGSDTASVSEAMGRLISLILRLPSPLTPTERLHEVVGQLKGIGGGRHLGYGPARIRSLPDAMAQVLAEHLGVADVEEITPAQAMPESVGDLCPECGQGTLVFEEGCQKCYSCGFTEC